MKTIISNPMKLCSLILLLMSSTVNAQKLADIQDKPVLAPSQVRIDGKATEWGDTFAAENKRTSLKYTIANDDVNLYVVMKAVGTTNINKVMMGGITFNVNADGKKKEKESIGITYPLIKRNTNRQGGGRQGMNSGAVAGGNVQMRGGFSGGGGQNRGNQSQAQRDSASLAQFKTQLATVKEIKISGFKNIADSSLSIYNEYGIKAAGNFDAEGTYTYELAIPLSFLEISSSKQKDLTYQIKVNGMTMQGFGNAGGGDRGGNLGGVSFGGGGGNFGGGGGGQRMGGGGFGGGNNMQEMMSPTDFWGKYTLAKK